jgi:hypothetical protein
MCDVQLVPQVAIGFELIVIHHIAPRLPQTVRLAATSSFSPATRISRAWPRYTAAIQEALQERGFEVVFGSGYNNRRTADYAYFISMPIRQQR